MAKTLSDINAMLKHLEKAKTPDGQFASETAFYGWVKPPLLKDGTQRPSTLVYTPLMDQLWEILRPLRLDPKINPYEGTEDFLKPLSLDWIESASLDDLKKVVWLIGRGEKFCDGHWGNFICSGGFIRVLNRYKRFIETGDITSY